MQYRYTSKKPNINKDRVSIMYLRFTNGDTLPLRGRELVDLSIRLYDGLIADGLGYSPVAESGYIALDVSPYPSQIPSPYVYNESELRRDRKAYIENRCVREGGLCAVELRDDENWGRTIHGDLTSELRGGKLFLLFHPKRNGGASSEAEHCIFLRDVEKNYVKNIHLAFANFEGFTVYEDEIAEINLQFEPTLAEGREGLERRIKSGHLTVKLDKDRESRETNLHLKPHPTSKQLEKRLTGGEAFTEHDICSVYVHYWDGITEGLRVDNRPETGQKRAERAAWGGSCDFVGGHCTRLPDGSFKITFGKQL